MDQKILDFLTKNTGIKNEEDILSKYQEKHTNKLYIEDNNIIGHVAANLRTLNYKGEDNDSAFIIDSVVDTDRRKEGIYTKLYRDFEKEINADVFFALPLQYELLNLVDKQDYKIVGEVKAYAKILNSENVIQKGFLGGIAKMINKISSTKVKNVQYSGFEIKEDINFDDIDELYYKVREDYGFMSARSADWVKSRINNRINYKIMGTYKDGIEGYIIYKVIERSKLKYFMIMDILYSSREALESMYDFLYEKANNENVNLIGLWQNSKTRALISDKRFQDARSSFPVVAKGNDERLFDIENWFLQPIEGETY